MLVINNLSRIFRWGLSLSEIEEKISNSESILQENQQQISKNNAEIEQELQAVAKKKEKLEKYDDFHKKQYEELHNKHYGLLTAEERTELTILLDKFNQEYSENYFKKLSETEKAKKILLDDASKQREIQEKLKQILLYQIHNASKDQSDRVLTNHTSFPTSYPFLGTHSPLSIFYKEHDWDQNRITEILIRFNPEYPKAYIETLRGKKRQDLINRTLSEEEELQNKEKKIQKLFEHYEGDFQQKLASKSKKRLTESEIELLSRYSSAATQVLDGIVTMLLNYDRYLGEERIKDLSESTLLSLREEMIYTAKLQNTVDQILTRYNIPLLGRGLSDDEKKHLDSIVQVIENVNKLITKYKTMLSLTNISELSTIHEIKRRLENQSQESKLDREQSNEDNQNIDKYLDQGMQASIVEILSNHTSHSKAYITDMGIAEKEMLLKILLLFKGPLTEEDIKELSVSNRILLAKYILISKKSTEEDQTFLNNYINRVERGPGNLEELLADLKKQDRDYRPLSKQERTLLSKCANVTKAEREDMQYDLRKLPQVEANESKLKTTIEKSNKKVTELQEMNAKLEQKITYERGRLIKYYEQHALAEKAAGKEEFTYASQIRDHIGEQIQQINEKLASNKKSSDNSISKEIGLKIEKAVALYKELQLSDRETHSSLVSENIANAVSTLGSMAKAPTIGITKTIQRGANLTATIVTSPLRLQRYLSKTINNETPYNGMPIEKMSKDLAEIIRDKMKGLEDKIRRM